ncbi:MAG TPA: right-handed parallel beta-helix repeat-containing protein, partial [Pirellulaceae bacterium]|nr:right-handed parallel beta-helix repeat-containing protein [Pirellulaceae bacterium]
LSDVQTNIHLAGVRGATIVGNTLWQGYSHNIHLEECTAVVIGANMLERNPLYGYTSEGKDGVLLRRCRDCTIQGLHLHNVIGSPAGLILENCDRLHVTGCTILDCDNAGLLVKDCQRSTILGNVIRDDRDAATTAPIKVEGGAANTIQNP